MHLRGTDGLFLAIGIDFEIYETGGTGKDRYRVRTVRYEHQVLTQELEEVVLFHWHPAEEDGLPVRVQPHIHIGPKLLDTGAALTKSAHVPSGRVSVEDVVEFLIRDCRTTPQREDWLAVLTESRDKFRAHANWGTGHPRLHTRAVTGLTSKLAGIKKRAARRKK